MQTDTQTDRQTQTHTHSCTCFWNTAHSLQTLDGLAKVVSRHEVARLTAGSHQVAELRQVFLKPTKRKNTVKQPDGGEYWNHHTHERKELEASNTHGVVFLAERLWLSVYMLFYILCMRDAVW